MRIYSLHVNDRGANAAQGANRRLESQFFIGSRDNSVEVLKVRTDYDPEGQEFVLKLWFTDKGGDEQILTRIIGLDEIGE